MAHKKSGGIAQNIKDSPGQRLGVKRFAGEKVISGNIIIRQRGTKYFPGFGVKIGKDHTIFAVIDGVVSFSEKKQTKFDGRVFKDVFVHVKPALVTKSSKVSK